MTTLAQHLYEDLVIPAAPPYGHDPRVSLAPGGTMVPVRQVAGELLILRLTGMVDMRSPLRADLDAAENRIAERFSFDQNAPSVILERVKEGEIDDQVLMQLVKEPTMPMWVEWPCEDYGPGARLGYLFDPFLDQQGTGNPSVICAMGFKHDDGQYIAGPYAIFSVGKMGSLTPEITVHWAADQSALDTRAEAFCRTMYSEIVATLFCLMTPKLTIDTPVTHNPKLQRARHKRGKLPLIEYRKITMVLGAPIRRSSGSRSPAGADLDDEITHRRRHHVIGHFRTYKEGRAEPKISYVPPHWRGDASLGIILHDRTVVTK